MLHRRAIMLIAAASMALASAAESKDVASWYGYELAGRLMANGRKFNPRTYTAASWRYPLGSAVRVTNASNGRSITVTITDRGPAFWTHRTIDLSLAAARALKFEQRGVTRVTIKRIR
jgi:rare lipoprotein A